MKAQHTPGPWKVDEVGRHFDEEYLRLHNRFKLVGKEMDNIAYIPEIHPEAEANARLIAAAPDLLSACEFTLARLRDMTTEDFSKGGDKMAREELVKAIAKAKGPC